MQKGMRKCMHASISIFSYEAGMVTSRLDKMSGEGLEFAFYHAAYIYLEIKKTEYRTFSVRIYTATNEVFFP